MANTTFLFPSTNAANGASTQWTNPSNAYNDDTNYATVNASIDAYQLYDGFGFSIPSGATIDGLELVAKVKVSAVGETCLLRAYIIDSNMGLRNKTINPTTTETEYTFGDSTDLWGGTFTSAWINDEAAARDKFCVMMQAYNTGGSTSLNYIKLKIYYTEISGPTKLKTRNGLEVAKIKTINGLEIAKIKTLNGLS